MAQSPSNLLFHSPTQQRVSLLSSLLATTMMVAAPGARAQSVLPQGGEVVAGAAMIATDGTHSTIVTQTSNRAVVDWNSFSVGQNNQVQFVQPTTQSAILNRVTGNATSTIAGQITGNGQVFLVNPNGIAITATGSAKLGGGFVASTLDIANSDFMNANLAFKGSSTAAEVANAGAISIGKGGFAALLGGRVSNTGLISVPLGKVGLGAGEAATLDLYSDGFLQIALPSNAEGDDPLVKAAGSISGARIVISAASLVGAVRDAVYVPGNLTAQGAYMDGGAIVLEGGAGTTTVTGRLVASSDTGKGGNIAIGGTSVALSGASLNASGAQGGGQVTIGGGRHGASVAGTTTAQTVSVDANSTIKADGIKKGNGGDVVIWSDRLTRFEGLVSAQALGDSGDGGQAEVSGKERLIYNGITDLRAANGRTGDLLLDPYNVTISSAADTGGFDATGDDSVINVTTLTNALATANVTVTTGSSGTQAGNITVDSALNWSANTALTLNAAGGIIVNANITKTGASSGLNLIANGTGGISGSGNIANTGPVYFNVADATATGIYSGILSGAGSVFKQGAGSLTLASNNSFTGNVTIDGGGKLILTHSNALGVGTKSIYVTSGNSNITLQNNITLAAGINFKTSGTSGVITSNGDNTINGTITLYAGSGASTIVSNSGTLTLNGNIENLTTARNLTLGGAGSGIINGTISDGSGAVNVIVINGNWTFTANNTYTGGTSIYGVATLQIGNGGTTGSLSTGAVNSNGTLIFNRSDALSVANVIYGAGSLVKNGTNTLTLTGANTYSGSTNVNGGTLKAGSTTAFGTNSALNVSATGTLDLAGFATSIGSLAGLAGGLVTNSGAAATLTMGGNNTSTNFAGVVQDGSGAITLTKAGTGTQTLSGDNTYTGTTTISAGSLQIGNGGASGTLGTGNVINNGNIAFNRSDALTVGNVISGTGSLTKNGTGTTTLTATNTYTGAVAINAGELSVLNTSATSTVGWLGGGAVAIAGGATLSFNNARTSDNGYVVTNVISGAGSVRLFGPDGSITTLNSANTYSGGTNISSGIVNLGNNAAFGTGTVTMTGGAFRATGGARTFANSFNLSGTIGLGSQTNVSGAVTLAGNTTITASTNSGGNTWSGAINLGAYTLATGDTGPNTNLGTWTGQTLTISGAVSGTGGITQGSAGTLFLSGVNTYTGATNVNSGTLRAGTTVAFGSNSAVTIGAAGTLDLGGRSLSIGSLSGAAGGIFTNNGGAATLTIGGDNTSTNFAGVMRNGTGIITLTKAGTGTQTFTGANTYTGTTTISGGALQIGDGGTTGTLGTGAVVNNANLIFNRSDALTVANAISGTGSLTKNGTGTTTLTGANTYSGATTINAGTLQVGNGGTTGSLGTGAIVNNANLTYLFDSTKSVATPQNYSGTGNLSLTAGMVWYPANLTVGGNLSINSTSNSSAWMSLQTAVNPILTVGGTTSITGYLAGRSPGSSILTINSTGAINLNNVTNGVVGSLWNWGTLNLNAGTSAINITGDNVMSQANVSSTWNLTGAINISGNVSHAFGGTQTLNLNTTADSSISGNLAANVTLVKSGSSILTLSGSNTHTGATTINGGTLKAGSATALSSTSALTVGAAGTLDLAGYSNSVGSLAGVAGGIVTNSGAAATLTAGGNNTSTTFAGRLQDGTGALSLTKVGTGTLTLSGANTQTGATNVNAGTLSANINVAQNAIGTGAVNVETGATLKLNNLNTSSSNVTLANTFTGTGTLNVAFATGNTARTTILSNLAGFTGNVSLTTAGSTGDKLGLASAIGGSVSIGNGTTLHVGSAGRTIANGVSVTGTGNAEGKGALRIDGGGVLNSDVILTGNATFGAHSIGGGTLNGVVSGNFNVTKNGTSGLIFAGDNTYTGTTTVSAGTLQIGNGGTTGTLGSGAVTNTANLTFNRSDALTVANAISGTGTLTQAGSGTTTLTGANTYTGATNVNAGTLALGAGGSLNVGAGTATVSVASGATLSGTGVVTANALAFSGLGTINLTGNNAVNTLAASGTTGALTYNSVVQLGVNAITTNGSAVSITSTIADSASASNALTINGAMTTNGGNITLTGTAAGSGWGVRNSGALSAGAGSVTLTGTATTNGGVTLSNNVTTTTGDITIVGLATAGTAVGGGANLSTTDGNISVTGQASSGYAIRTSGFGATSTGLGNIAIDATGVLYFCGGGGCGSRIGVNVSANQGSVSLTATSQILFGNADANISSANNQVTIDGSFTSFSNNSIVNISNGLASSITDNISGAGSIIKSGAGTLTLSGNNSYTGGTSINGGVLAVGSANALATTGDIGFGGGTLQYSASNTTDYSGRFLSTGNQAWKIDTNGQNVTFASALIGAGSALEKSGAGTLTLTGANIYDGTTSVNAGTLALNGSWDRGTGTASVAVANGATLTGTGIITADVLNLSGTGSVNLTGNNLVNRLATSGAIGSLAFKNAQSLTVGSVDASSIALQTVGADSDLTLDSGTVLTASDTGTAIVLAAGRNFINNAGSGAISLTGAGAPNWQIYSLAPGGNVFGGLDSGTTAVWNTTYGQSVSQTGNRYIFAYQPTLVVTSTDLRKTYGDDATTAVAAAYTISGLHSGATGAFLGDTLASVLSGNVSVTSTGSAASASVAGGPYALTVDTSGLTGLLGYAVSDASTGVLTVNKRALTVIGDTSTSTYNANTQTNGFTTTGLFGTDNVASVLGLASGTNAGSYSDNLSGATGDGLLNYDITYQNGGLVINKAALTITSDNSTSTYNANTQTNGFTTTGLFGTDNVASVAGLASATNAGTYSDNLGSATGAGLLNYDITYQNGGLVINKAALTITGENSTSTYNANTQTNGFTTSGLLGADNVATVAGLASGTNAGSYSDNLSNASGSGLVNYDVLYQNGSLAIDKAALTISGNTTTGTYNGNVQTNGFTTSGLLGSDNVSSVTGLASATDAGTYVDNLSGATGAGLINYDISYQNGSLAIDKAKLFVTGAQNSVTYNGASQSNSGASLSGAVGGDSFTITGYANGTNAGTYVDALAVNAQGATRLSNYDITIQQGQFTINKAALTVKANDLEQAYSAQPFAGGNGITITGLLGGDTQSALTGAPVYSGSAQGAVQAGDYEIAVSGLDGANYVINFVSGALRILPQTQIVTPPAPTIWPSMTLKQPTVFAQPAVAEAFSSEPEKKQQSGGGCLVGRSKAGNDNLDCRV